MPEKSLIILTAEQISHLLSSCLLNLEKICYQISNYSLSLKEMIKYIQDKKTFEDEDEDDNNSIEEYVLGILEELFGFLMEYDDDSFEVMVFFKTCFLNFDLKIKDMRQSTSQSL